MTDLSDLEERLSRLEASHEALARRVEEVNHTAGAFDRFREAEGRGWGWGVAVAIVAIVLIASAFWL